MESFKVTGTVTQPDSGDLGFLPTRLLACFFFPFRQMRPKVYIWTGLEGLFPQEVEK